MVKNMVENNKQLDQWFNLIKKTFEQLEPKTDEERAIKKKAIEDIIVSLTATIEHILERMEADIEVGKITDAKQISQIKEYKKILDDLKRN